MKRLVLLTVVLAFALAVALHAQDVAPELAPAQAKYKADLAALETQRTAALARVQAPYVTALDSAEKAAIAAGTLDIVAAITKEREAIKSGAMEPAFPEGLPKTLQAPRKACLDGSAKVGTDLTPRVKAINADYFRALTALQAKAAANSELAKQIAAEKEKVLASQGATAAAPASGGPGKPKSDRSPVVNGDFSAAEADGSPTSWRLEGKPGVAFKVVREGNSSFARVTAEPPAKDVWAVQELDVPARAKTLTMKARIRGKWTDRQTTDGNWGANVAARFRDSADQLTGAWFTLVSGREAGSWKTISQTYKVEPGAKKLHFKFGVQWVAGTFDFDDVEVEFR